MTAQTIVSTTPANKNALIEEYTGIHCGYCPDGHEISNTIIEANPGRAYAINIHQGSYAVPSTGEPDYRTIYGDALAGQTGLTGYPAGTVNRHVFSGSTTALSRSAWSSSCTTIMGQASPVNIAIDVDLDYATRELTILVEVYYTANSTADSLNVAILQDWVKGPQSNYGPYNTSYITPDGYYYHMHMLRDLITGQWGIAIPASTAGTFWDSTFTVTVPATYGAIPAELPNLDVVAFITEGKQEVVTATGMPVPPPAVDASVSTITGLPTFTCANSFIPTVTIKNKGQNDLTSVDIEYFVDSQTPAVYNWTGTLTTGQTADVILPSITISSNGSHTFTAQTTNPNSTVDGNLVNDIYIGTFAAFISNGSAPVVEGFTSTTFPPTNFAVVDADVDGKLWARSTAGHTAAGSAFMNFYSISSGKKDDLIIAPLDLTGMSNMAITFWVAYRQYQTENDKLQVDVSTNCGTTWTTKWSKSGSSLSTGAATTSSFTSPTAGEWRQEVVDLSAYDNTADVLVRFRSTSAYGNNLFLDDINLAMGASINENESFGALSVYPNPASDLVTISVDSRVSANANISVMNTLGEVVLSTSSWMNTGNNTLNLNTSDLGDGVYFIRILSGSEVINSTFVIER